MAAQNMQYGGWYDNPAAGGKNMRFWGDKGWTDGAEPGGAAPSGGGSASAAPAAPHYEYNPAAYDNLLTKVQGATSDFAKGVDATENSAFDDYINVIKSQPTSVDFYNNQLEQAGVPELRKSQSTLQGQIYDLEDTLRRVEPNVTATTGQSLVTESQRQGMVTEKQKPLIQDLGWLGQSLGRVSGAITDATGQALTLTNLNSQDQEKLVQAYKDKLSLATTQGNRALEAFSKDIDNVLNVTLAKIQRQEKVSDSEAANAFELLKLQKTAEYNMQAEAAKSSTEVVEVGGRKKLIDKKTGAVISDLGAATSGTSGTGADLSKYLTPQNTTPTYDPNLYKFMFSGTTQPAPSAQLKTGGGGW
jgi:esterase/lipase